MRNFSDNELEELCKLAKEAFGDIVEDGVHSVEETLSLMRAGGASEQELDAYLAELDVAIEAKIRRRLVHLLSPKRSLH